MASRSRATASRYVAAVGPGRQRVQSASPSVPAAFSAPVEAAAQRRRAVAAPAREAPLERVVEQAEQGDAERRGTAAATGRRLRDEAVVERRPSTSATNASGRATAQRQARAPR